MEHLSSNNNRSVVILICVHERVLLLLLSECRCLDAAASLLPSWVALCCCLSAAASFLRLPHRYINQIRERLNWLRTAGFDFMATENGNTEIGFCLFDSYLPLSSRHNLWSFYKCHGIAELLVLVTQFVVCLFELLA